MRWSFVAGVCDTSVDGANYNTAACGWDLGDCCPPLGVAFERACGSLDLDLPETAASCPGYASVNSSYECRDPHGCQALDLTALGDGV